MQRKWRDETGKFQRLKKKLFPARRGVSFSDYEIVFFLAISTIVPSSVVGARVIERSVASRGECP